MINSCSLLKVDSWNTTWRGAPSGDHGRWIISEDSEDKRAVDASVWRLQDNATQLVHGALGDIAQAR
eukprot:4118336-Karenia_brevis.AAC.1